MSEAEQDSVSCAESNRAASKKFFTHLMQPGRALISIDCGTQMLHRSPSGAKRLIRQREERAERCSRPSPFLPQNTPHTSESPAVQNYRSLIDSGGYESILPELNSSFSPSSTARLSPSPMSSSMSCLDSTATATAKPTVEVHPMPGRGNRDKPAVPAKPKGLKLLESPIIFNRSNSVGNLNCPSSVFVDSLFTTPSFINLRTSITDTVQLEERKADAEQHLMARISRLEEESCLLERDMAINEENGQHLLAVLALQVPALHHKTARQVQNERELVSLQTKLGLQLGKLAVHHSQITHSDNEAVTEEKRIRRKLAETGALRTLYARREREVYAELALFLSPQQLAEWNAYKESLLKMVVEARQIQQRLQDAQQQMRSIRDS